VNCPNCGHQNPAMASYCSICRTELQIDVTDPQNACPECGSIVPEDAKFCSSCGHVVNAQSMAASGIPPRSLGDLISETFSVYRKSFWKFVLIGIVPQIGFSVAPLLVGELGAVGALFAAIGVLIGIALTFLANGALVCAVAQQYTGRTVDVVKCYRRAWSQGFSILGVGVLVVLAGIGSSLLMIILVGIPLFFWILVIWFFAIDAVIIEGKGSIGALGRSNALVKGSWWRVFGIGVVFTLLMFGIIIVGGISFSIVLLFSPFLSVVGIFVFSALMIPVAIGRTLVYIDLRVRNEDYSLEQLAVESSTWG
jgi:hypothetical protein